MKLLKNILLVVMLLAACAAHADDYPNRPIRIIVPFSPGTGIDILARSAGPDLAASLGQPVVVDNRAGASGLIGTRDVQKAAPDGYTLLMVAIGHATLPYIYPTSSQYDPVKDFTPISFAAWGRLMLVVNPKSGIKTFDEFIQRAKANPGKLTYGSPGPGAPHHLAMELLSRRAGFKILHVPFSDTAGAVTAVLGNQVDAMFLPVHVAMSFVRAGRLNALGLASAQRSALAPDMPTLAELGYPGTEADIWYGLLGPAGLPPAIQSKLHDAMAKALADPAILGKLQKQGLEPASSTPQEFSALIQRESLKWGEIIQQAGLKAE